jgi:hypothetical protein
MNARPTFDPYRIFLDYEGLEDGFIDRIEDLNTTFDQIDERCGFTRGEMQKLVSKSRERWARTFGVVSLGKALKGTGMALALVVIDESVRNELIARKRPRKPAIAGSARPTWLFGKKKAREMGKKRFSLMSDAERKRHQRKAGKASGRARRRKARQKAGALLASTVSTSCANAQAASQIQRQMVLDAPKGQAASTSIPDAARHAAAQ